MSSLKSTLVNIVPVVLLGVSVRLLVRRYLVKAPLALQVGAHFILAIVFTNLWYLLVLVASSFHLQWLTSGIRITPFYQSATLWQLFQGLVMYSAMQGLIYGRWLQERLHDTQSALRKTVDQGPPAVGGTLSSVFVKSEGEFKKIDLNDLMHIEANGDQVVLHTKLGHFTCNKALSDYARKLEDNGYIRIHRSHLVRAASILAAEPTGDGRLSIHLETGTSIIASRTGTRAFRDFTRE
ncbi:MAG: LytTR family DNA-binding domain-containing protein [Pseudomonadota bacterium]